MVSSRSRNDPKGDPKRRGKCHRKGTIRTHLCRVIAVTGWTEAFLEGNSLLSQKMYITE